MERGVRGVRDKIRNITARGSQVSEPYVSRKACKRSGATGGWLANRRPFHFESLCYIIRLF